MSVTTSGPKQLPLTDPLSLKLHSLNELNSTIQHLESSLKTLQVARGILEGEIATLRATNATIKRIPMETLTQIFRDITTLEDFENFDIKTANSNRINLMLTCKHWREIFVGTPSLWSSIYVKTPAWGHPNVFRWAKCCHRYLDLCLARSGDVGLNIAIKLEDAIGGSTYARIRAERALKVHFADGEDEDEDDDDDDDEDNDEDELGEWLGTVDWDDCPTADAYNNVLEEMLYKLVGAGGKHASRWRSLVFTLPRHAESRSLLWKLFQWPLPGLQSLIVTGNSVGLEQPSDSLISLDSLRKLLIVGPFAVDLLPNSTSLHSLTIWVVFNNHDWTTLHSISQFPALRELTIEVLGGDEHYEEYVSIDDIRIPFLNSLSLSGDVPSFVFQAFDIKKLTTLKIKEGDYQITSLPQARIFSVVEHLIYADNSPRAESASKEILSGVLGQASILRVLVVQDRLIKAAIKAVASCRKRGFAESLESIITFSGGETDQKLKLVYLIPLGIKMDVNRILSACEPAQLYT